jgi:hypothetical protein
VLHAVAKCKPSIFRRYHLGKRDKDELKLNAEDEITSIILGPLEFLTVSDHYRLWRCVLTEVGRAEFLPKASPLNVTLKLWHSRVAADTKKPIEPDAIVHMTWPNNNSRILLIELKWRASLGSSRKHKHDQLHRQWMQYLTAEERGQAMHLFIAPDISAGIQAAANEEAGGNVWLKGDRLVPISWLHIRAILDKFANESLPLNRWAQLTNKFLEAVGIRRFTGFKYLNTNLNLSLPQYLPEKIFWSQFSFARLGNSPVFMGSLPNTIFFNQS